MSAAARSRAISVLRWVLGVVVILEAVQFAASSSVASHLVRLGIPLWVRPAIGIGEIVAAVLFLTRKTTLVGGYLLLAVFGVAALLHVLHGEYEVGSLAVYAAGVLVCNAFRDVEGR